MDSETDSLELASKALCATARLCHERGWVPATSGNFSVREGGRVLVTASGLDKGALTADGLLEVDLEGRGAAGAAKPSAEVGLHLAIYRKRPEARAILHVHSVWSTLISGRFAATGYVTLEGYEIEKALSGVTTHKHEERVQILPNSQDYGVLAGQMTELLVRSPRLHAVLLSRHGVYTWGSSVAEAQRHLEALEFLFEVEWRRLTGGQP